MSIWESAWKGNIVLKWLPSDLDHTAPLLSGWSIAVMLALRTVVDNKIIIIIHVHTYTLAFLDGKPKDDTNANTYSQLAKFTASQ